MEVGNVVCKQVCACRKLEAENGAGTWARIVPPCTILASGFVNTKPAYLKLFIRPDTRSEKLQVSDVLGVSLKLGLKIGHRVIILSGFAIVPTWKSGMLPLCLRTLRNYAYGRSGILAALWRPASPPSASLVHATSHG